MKKLILFFLIFSAFIVKAQDEKQFKNVIAIDPLALLGRTVSLSYTRKLNKQLEFTFNPKYQPRINNGTHILWFTNHDPIWLYENISLSAGLRKVFKKPFYIEASLLLKYGAYDNILFSKYIDRDGEQNDVDYLISRSHKMIGGILNTGYIFDKKRFRLNVFCGIGYRYRWTYEKIMGKQFWQDNQLRPENPPIKSITMTDFITLHTGIELGLKW